MKGHPFHVDAVLAEGVDVAVPDLAPVHKLDAELERALGRSNEVILVQPEQIVEQANLGDGRLPHPDRADLFGLDQVDVAVVGAQDLGEGRRRHPARSPPAHDDDLADPLRVSGRDRHAAAVR